MQRPDSAVKIRPKTACARVHVLLRLTNFEGGVRVVVMAVLQHAHASHTMRAARSLCLNVNGQSLKTKTLCRFLLIATVVRCCRALLQVHRGDVNMKTLLVYLSAHQPG
jgi:hypothetical protein